MKKCIYPLIAGALYYVFLAMLFYGYRYGFSAAFQFDDYDNLSWLSGSKGDIQYFSAVFGGNAGPLGRPVSLAAFLVDGYYWPFDSIPLHRTNALLHLLNSCLLAALLLRLRYLVTPKFPLGLLILAACLWSAMPLLASTIFSTVQRMTLLSAAFTLAGIWLYLTGRAYLSDKPRVGAALMAGAVCAFTPLAVLSKENGALLPLYIAVIEYTLLPPLPASLAKRQKSFLRLLLAIPIMAVAAYLALQLFNFTQLQASYSSRPFTLSGRLQTEAAILWQYLRLAFFPDMAALGPYHDAHPVYGVTTHPILVPGSFLAWMAAVGAAVYFRKTTPLPLFAVAWFLGGHVLESSFIPLELYFEHRNYMPLIGPVYAFTIGMGAALKNTRIRYCALGAYLAMQLFILLQTSQLWGDPLKSAYYWAGRQPDSIRAAQFLAQQLMRRHRLGEAGQTIAFAVNRHPDDAGLLLQQLQLQCEMLTLKPELLAQTQSRLHQVRYNNTAARALNGLADLAIAKRCAVLDTPRLHGILATLTGNGGFYHGGGAYHLHHIQARLYEQEKKLAPAIEELEQALKIDPTLDTFLRLSSILSDAGYYEAALRPLADARRHLPENPFVRRYWLEQLDAYTYEIDAYRHEYH